MSRDVQQIKKLWIGGMAAALVACGMMGCESMTPGKIKSQDASGQTVVQDKSLTGDQAVPTQEGDEHATYATPDEAVTSLLAAVQSTDHDALHKVFGPATRELVSADKVEAANDFKDFAQKTQERAQLEQKDANTEILHIGNDDWPFPIPIVKNAEGRWYFDTKAGSAEILARRVGANELNAINVCREYVNAQREYASTDRDGSGVQKYAQRLKSHPGMKDGLYWDSKDVAGQSPFGPLAANAGSQGYGPVSGSKNNPQAYHGYFFHILTKQGPDAPGGAYDYVINGNMIAGFALVASPEQYGKSGVMTFIVSHQGKVYQKDAGADSAEIAKAMTVFNPDSTWTLVK